MLTLHSFVSACLRWGRTMLLKECQLMNNWSLTWWQVIFWHHVMFITLLEDLWSSLFCLGLQVPLGCRTGLRLLPCGTGHSLMGIIKSTTLTNFFNLLLIRAHIVKQLCVFIYYIWIQLQLILVFLLVCKLDSVLMLKCSCLCLMGRVKFWNVRKRCWLSLTVILFYGISLGLALFLKNGY